MSNFVIVLAFSSSVKCVTCENETSGAHSSKICKAACHAISPCCITFENEEEGLGKNVFVRNAQDSQLYFIIAMI